MTRRERIVDLTLSAAAVAAAIWIATFVWREFHPAEQKSAVYERRHLSHPDELLRGGHALGDADAPIRIAEFSDFQCPFCRRLHQTITTLLNRYPGQFSVVYRHYPLAGHALAFPAAIASECAAAQGRFETYANLLFEKQDSLGILPWETLASRAGIPDTAQFRACRNDNKMRQSIDADIGAGTQLKITGTPVLIIGGQMIVGALPIDTLEALLRTENGGRPFLKTIAHHEGS